MSEYKYKNRYGDEFSFFLQDDNTVDWVGDFGPWVRFSPSEDGKSYSMIDPSGGPYIKVGMPSQLVHPEVLDQVVDKITLSEFGYSISFKPKQEDQ